MIKRIFLDTETTGVNRLTCGVWQIGGIIDCGKRIEEFQFECDIFDEDEVDEKALQMNNLSKEILAGKPDPIDAIQRFQQMLARYIDKFDRTDKLYFINFGAEFDAEVIRQWFLKCGDDYYGSWFWHPPIDVMVLAMQYLTKTGQRSAIRSFSLESVAMHFNIPIEASKLHGALYDAHVARALYYKVTEP